MLIKRNRVKLRIENIRFPVTMLTFFSCVGNGMLNEEIYVTPVRRVSGTEYENRSSQVGVLTCNTREGRSNVI